MITLQSMEDDYNIEIDEISCPDCHMITLPKLFPDDPCDGHIGLDVDYYRGKDDEKVYIAAHGIGVCVMGCFTTHNINALLREKLDTIVHHWVLEQFVPVEGICDFFAKCGMETEVTEQMLAEHFHVSQELIHEAFELYLSRHTLRRWQNDDGRICCEMEQG